MSGAVDTGERVRLRRTSRTAGVAEVRLPGVRVDGVMVEERPDGSLAMRAPAHLRFDAVWRDAILADLAVLWAAS